MSFMVSRDQSLEDLFDTARDKLAPLLIVRQNHKGRMVAGNTECEYEDQLVFD